MKEDTFLEKYKAGKFDAILNSFKDDDNFIIVTHPGPDGDCVGSSLALSYFLKNFYGKNCCILTDNKEKFLTIKTKIDSALKNERSEQKERGERKERNEEGESDSSNDDDDGESDGEKAKIRLFTNFSYQDACLFCIDGKNKSKDSDENLDSTDSKLKATFVYVDSSGLVRCSRVFESEFYEMLLNNVKTSIPINNFHQKSIVIDHHPRTNDELEPNVSLVDPQSPSAAELVYYLIKATGYKFDLNVSTYLFYAISSDTGSFKFVKSAEGNSTFLVASDLVEAGAMPNIITTAITSGKERSANKYFIALAETAEYIRNGKVVIVCDREEFLKEYGINSRPSDELYRFFLDTKGVEVLMVLKLSSEPNFVEVSIRVNALCDFDASSFSRQFGGGGHKAAAGFRTSGTIENVSNAIKRALTSFKI